ncbi:MAG: N(4)-(beta-N-acetylglucosaminyl)-L-asparaginase [Planctomycetota bacterium]
MHELSRRGFMGVLGAGAVSTALTPHAPGQDGGDGRARGPIAIASGNGIPATREALAMMQAGADPLDAAVAGVGIVEADPKDMTVGLGGLPNEEGVVELDASVMHGPMHRAGAVASLRNIVHPAAVAREVARRTDHVLLVGEGALRFARRLGFPEQDLLTVQAREAWLRWKNNANREDDWLEEGQFDLPGEGAAQSARPIADPQTHLAYDEHGVPWTDGTIHCSVRTADGDLAGVTTTSGLSWKIPGRVGDSPIIGAGLYTDNEVGSAGATGRGEAAIQVCAARSVVMAMEQGDLPRDACLRVLRDVARKTKLRRLLRPDGRPNFGLTLYALRKDGMFGGASFTEGASFAVSDGFGHRLAPCATPW